MSTNSPKKANPPKANPPKANPPKEANTPAKTSAPMDEESFRDSIWATWKSVHDDIGGVREDAYKVLYVRKWRDSEKAKEADELGPCYNLLPPGPKPEELLEFSIKAAGCARKFEEDTQKLDWHNKSAPLWITNRAGVLLSYVEELMLRFDDITQKKAPNQLPLEVRVNILSNAMTVAATARDQILAAKGFVQNLKEALASMERGQLLLYGLVPAVVVYLVFNPVLKWFPLSLPLEYRIYWEIAFWSIFGVIAKSLIAIAEDSESDLFDPRHRERYFYRIPVAPFVAGALIAFVSLFGATYGTTTISLSLTSPNFGVIILLSFIFGFFAKRSIELLNEIMEKLFPQSKSDDAKKIGTTS